MKIFCYNRIRIVSDDVIWLFNQFPKTKTTHIQCNLILCHYVSLAEEALFHQNHEIVLLVATKTFYFKKCFGTDSVLDNDAVKETHQIIILPGSANLMNERIPFCIYLSLTSVTIKLVTELFIVFLGMIMPAIVTPSPVFQVGFLIHSCFYFCFWVIWSL